MSPSTAASPSATESFIWTGGGQIISSTPRVFLARLGGSNLASNIYYAALGKDKPLPKSGIAIRALDAVGKHRSYHVLTYNCHGFSIRYINGKSSCQAAWSIREIENSITSAFGTNEWRWRCWDGWR